MKYIVTENEDGIEEIFTFPDSVHHDAMAEILNRIKNQTHGNWERIRRRPVSAGFVMSSGTCFGSSETLSLSSRPQDSDILAKTYRA